jgi:hypothetical protein
MLAFTSWARSVDSEGEMSVTDIESTDMQPSRFLRVRVSR